MAGQVIYLPKRPRLLKAKGPTFAGYDHRPVARNKKAPPSFSHPYGPTELHHQHTY